METSAGTWAAALVVLGLLLLAGQGCRVVAPGLRRLLVPASVLGGLVGLALGPHVLGKAAPLLGDPGAWMDGGLFSEGVLGVWRALPGLLISVVFACLFLGRELPSPRTVWRLAGPQAAFGQTLAWGQYAIGITLAWLVLEPWLGTNVLSGALIEIGFQGGHGTAAGLSETFREFGFAEGEDLALALATIGVLAGLLLGFPMIYLAARSGRLQVAARPGSADERGRDPGPRTPEPQESAPPSSPGPEHRTVESLTLQWGVISLTLALAWLLLRGMTWIEERTWGGEDGLVLLGHMPLFPLAMVAGFALQLLAERLGVAHHIDRRLVERVGGGALDLVVVSALAALDLGIVAGEWRTVLLLAGAGTAWNVCGFYLLAPRILPDHWFTRGIGDFGQSMGMTVTGLLMMRVADPEERTSAVQAFGYKQLLFEPLVGGGLMTAAAIPLIAQLGARWVLVLCTLLCITWALIGVLAFGRSRPTSEPATTEPLTTETD